MGQNYLRYPLWNGLLSLRFNFIKALPPSLSFCLSMFSRGCRWRELTCDSGQDSESTKLYRLQLRLWFQPKRSTPTDPNSGLDSDSTALLMLCTTLSIFCYPRLNRQFLCLVLVWKHSSLKTVKIINKNRIMPCLLSCSNASIHEEELAHQLWHKSYS